MKPNKTGYTITIISEGHDRLWKDANPLFSEARMGEGNKELLENAKKAVSALDKSEKSGFS